MPCVKCKELIIAGDFYTGKSRKDILGVSRVSICRNCSNQKYIDINDPRQKLLFGARNRAKQMGFMFNISVEDIVIPDHCPILGIKLEAAVGKGSFAGAINEFAPSIDRIVGDKGYVKGNICVISKRANLLKKHATLEELIAIYSYIVSSTQGIGLTKGPFIENPLIKKNDLISAARNLIHKGMSKNAL